MSGPKGLNWNHATQSWDYVFRDNTLDSMTGEFAASNPDFAKSWEWRLHALTAAYEHVESMHVHISHGGPTRADGERLLGQLKGVLFADGRLVLAEIGGSK